jgi:hypothetical protein
MCCGPFLESSKAFPAASLGITFTAVRIAVRHRNAGHHILDMLTLLSGRPNMTPTHLAIKLLIKRDAGI